MRTVIVGLIFWLAVPGPARAGYVWLGDWQVGAGTAGSSLSDAGAASVSVTGPVAQGGGSSSITFTRQFQVTDAPAGGLGLTLLSGFDAEVVYSPRSFGDVSGSGMIEGVPASSLSFLYTPPPGAYGRAFTFHDSAARSLALSDGIYTLGGSLTAGASAFTNPFGPATSTGGLTLDLATVPEPSGAFLTFVGAAGLLALGRGLSRRQRRPA